MEKTYHPSTGYDPIMELVSPLIFLDGKVEICFGTAVFIGPYIAITAMHVLEEYYSQHGLKDRQGVTSAEFNLLLCQQLEDKSNTWFVHKINHNSGTDIAILYVTPANEEASTYTFRPIGLKLIPPEIGDKIAIFGYPNSQVSLDATTNTFDLVLDSHTSTGEVTEVYKNKRDTVLQNFPSFAVSAKVQGGMSGAPVFDQSSGMLLGLVSSGFDDEEPPFTSNVALLWPIIPLNVEIPREGRPPDERYRFSDLARDGILYAPGWENIEVITNSDGTEDYRFRAVKSSPE